jgi:hypothetical protein
LETDSAPHKYRVGTAFVLHKLPYAFVRDGSHGKVHGTNRRSTPYSDQNKSEFHNHRIISPVAGYVTPAYRKSFRLYRINRMGMEVVAP